MKTAFVRGCLAALVLCSAVAGHAESYTTNVVNGVTTNVGGVYIVGDTGPFNGLIVTNAGALINTDGIIGNTAAASNNFALITGSSSIWSNASQFTVGVTGAFNSVTITNGGLLHDMYGYVGYNAAASNNTILVSGANSRWITTGLLQIGNRSAGNQLTISASGLVSVAGNAYIGFNVGGKNNTVLVTGAGSQCNIGSDLYVGYNGAGNQLAITNGGAVAVAGNACIGYDAGASNNQVNVAGGAFTVSGALDVRNGALALNGGALDVNGLWATNNTASATNAVVNFNAGTLTTHNDNQIIVPAGQNFLIGNTPGQTATWNLLGGTNSIVPVAGYSADVLLGNVAGAQANVLVSGSGAVWNNGGQLVVGFATNANNNQLTIQSGARLNTTKGDIGYDGANNSALVSGANTVWNNPGDLIVGDHTAGNRLTINSSGQVFSAYGYIGWAGAATNNTVLVTDAGSVWINSSFIAIGNYGSGNRLVISNGGQVVNNNNSGRIGYDAAASGNCVLVTGVGSIWSNRNTIVGDSGSGNQLTIQSGGLVVSISHSYVGLNPSSLNNTVLVTGADSRWLNGGILPIGWYGGGNQLTIADGGLVSVAGSVYLGWENSASNNSALVTGSGSVWAIGRNLLVGCFSGGNQLTIATGGVVTVADTAYVGYDAGADNNLLTVAGGSLTVTNAGTTGTLDLRRGTLTLNSGTVTVDAFLATNGASSVVAFNGGTLRTGGTTVSNGATFVVGNGSSSATLDLVGGTHSFANGLSISSNAQLTGTGTLLSPLTVAGTFSPGNSPGTLILSNTVTLAGGATFLVEMAGYAAGTGYDQLVVTGALTNNNATLTVSLLSFVPTNGSQFVIVDSAVSMIGTFLGAPEGSTNYFGSSEPFAITYAGGADNHDIVLTTVPEPSSFLLVAVAASLLAVGVGQRRRRC